MIEKLACKLGRNDEAPNIELAEYLCGNKDAAGIEEIVGGFIGADKAVASDCIKVLYEVGERDPGLVAGYADVFIAGLSSKSNRLVWGSMTALAAIAGHAPELLFKNLPAITNAYKNGSVITVDNSISVFAKLCKAGDRYAEAVLPLILNHLQNCRPKEVPQHAERASVCFNSENAGLFIEVLEKRIPVMKQSEQARINKLLKKLFALQA